ncbi:motility associated factor glycosyltransferase family protein [Campylobacter peloridis]|uniref:Motility associated factor glycosyltransferase family protein n=1 Tax=Campylobacter peloridis TaxID=488546 RepID=A0A5C7DRI2_9BACT|nr:6-hydroxymethylpterin diphosphokinase MptE-like protein [Campylobacter peloridis]TXE84412.1 motility associated factor glycosyltransferase family protein [Campylobacter peloridis]
MNENIYKANINSLNPQFQKIFEKINLTKYTITCGEDPLDINILDNRGGVMYENPLLQLNTMLLIYNQKYKLYPVLYFYGFGNGILYKALLQNSNLKHIVVFENDFEIIKNIFFYVDFSKELKENKLILAQDDINASSLLALISQNPFREFIRTYFLELHCKYYENFQKNILNLNNTFLSCIRTIATIKGTDAKDTLQGIEQFLKNIPDMLSKPSLKEFLNKRKAKAKNAIIVSTGPSLTKQLPLLKKYQENVVIFCADSSYPILAKENIKPDYVFSVERIDYTSEFFNNNFGKFDKDILFIIASVTHFNTIKYLKKNNRNFMLISKSTFEDYFSLHAFGYIDLAISVAHLAFIIANLLEFKNIIFIGQDLAYNALGESHPKNYLYTANSDSDLEKANVLAYGGKKYIKTNTTWDIFKTNLEYLITLSKANIYNATEGGARIEGTIEKPFKDLCLNLLKEKINKNYPNLENFSLHKRQEYLLKTYYKIIILENDINYYLEKYSKQILFIQKNSNDLEKIISYLDEINLDDFERNPLIKILLACYLDQLRFSLAKIYVITPLDENMRLNKLQVWIQSHLEYFQLILITLNNLKYILLNNKELIKNVSINNNLTKYIKIRVKNENRNF